VDGQWGVELVDVFNAAFERRHSTAQWAESVEPALREPHKACPRWIALWRNVAWTPPGTVEFHTPQRARPASFS